MNKKIIVNMISVLFLFGLSETYSLDIANSKHNLSVGGSGTVKAISETEVCIFCHAPHNTDVIAPLWNRYSSSADYVPYSSSTAVTNHGQPTGASKLCLSCHDGTIALGMVRSKGTEIQFSESTLPSGVTNVSTDLSDDHPVSFLFDSTLYTQHGQLNNPALLSDAVKLDSNGNLQCTSCHDPHNNQHGDFLVMNNGASAICTTCHDPTGWGGAIHKYSTATWNGTSPDPWIHTEYVSVTNNACENCHRPHSAGGTERITNNSLSEDNCFPCHNGNVSQANIKNEISNKLSVHPVTGTEVHDPTEDLVNPDIRHVECVDCHNPHAANDADASPPNASGALEIVKGINSNGSEVSLIAYEYELCFRCHADNLEGNPRINRQFVETDTRIETRLSNSSYHPIQGPGKNANVPSLISPYTTASVIYCTDCHNNDQGPGASGEGPNGPHGSDYEPILERQLILTDGYIESAAVYELCYKCHSQTSILANESFDAHETHVVGKKTACSTCHDPHGVGSSSHLINFNTDTDYVTPSQSSRLEFIDTGTFSGECYLNCHDIEHNPKGYP